MLIVLKQNPDAVLAVQLADHGQRDISGDEDDHAFIETGLSGFLDPDQGDGYNYNYLEPTGIEVEIEVFRKLDKANLIEEVGQSNDCGINAEYYRPRAITRRHK